MDESPFSGNWKFIENEENQKLHFLIFVAEKATEGFFSFQLEV